MAGAWQFCAACSRIHPTDVTCEAHTKSMAPRPFRYTPIAEKLPPAVAEDLARMARAAAIPPSAAADARAAEDRRLSDEIRAAQERPIAMHDVRACSCLDCWARRSGFNRQAGR